MSVIGWFSAVVATVCAVALAVSLAAVARTHVQAQAAADAAALAAVTAAPFVGGDGDSCASAGRAALANGARLVACDAERGAWALHAEVSVGLRARGPAAVLPPLVAHAAAELVPLPATARRGAARVWSHLQ